MIAAVLGVLAVVSGGLFLSSVRGSLLNYRSRVEGVNDWNNLVFVLNGLIFILIGLQLPAITRQLGDVGLGTATWYGLVISFALIVTRLLCTFGASLFTKFLSRFIPVANPDPGWRLPLIGGWAGMRGVVSLAAALSIPVLLNDEQPFPFRNLILFVTFIVILVTLVFQGLTLPWVIRKIKPEDKFAVISEREQETIIQKKIALASLKFPEEKYGEESAENERLNNLRERLKIDLKFFDPELKETGGAGEKSPKSFQSVYLEMLEAQRRRLNEMNRHSEFDEDLIRKYLGLIDVEEYKIREKQFQEADSE